MSWPCMRPRSSTPSCFAPLARLCSISALRSSVRAWACSPFFTPGARPWSFHPHVHCVVPGGGFSLDGRRWVRVRKVSFLFAVKALSRRFRTLFCNAVREAYADGSLHIPTEIVADAQALDLLLARSFKTDWHAYAKPPFGGPEQVLAYLANYTHRIAISNRRILSFDGETVTFSWRDYARRQRARRPWSSTPSSSCVASSSTSSRRASRASAITASSPIATVPPTSPGPAS